MGGTDLPVNRQFLSLILQNDPLFLQFSRPDRPQCLRFRQRGDVYPLKKVVDALVTQMARVGQFAGVRGIEHGIAGRKNRQGRDAFGQGNAVHAGQIAILGKRAPLLAAPAHIDLHELKPELRN